MKNNSNTFAAVALAMMFTLSPCGAVSSSAQQQPAPVSAPASPGAKKADDTFGSTLNQGTGDKRDPRSGAAASATPTAGDRLEADETRVAPAGASEEVQANRREGLSEEERVVIPYYNNFMTSYRLGPEDVISVRVFGQERYSVQGVSVPPDGVIAYPLIKEGIQVAGKTTRQVAAEITKHLDEYIIDPKVSVSLDKAMSAVFSVMGDVGSPGIRPMTRRLSVREAVTVAGGILPTGKRQVMVLRTGPDGMVSQTEIDIAKIEKGKMPDNYFLSPGDQVFVPGNKMKTLNKVINLIQIASFARIFMGGGF